MKMMGELGWSPGCRCCPAGSNIRARERTEVRREVDVAVLDWVRGCPEHYPHPDWHCEWCG